MSQPIPWPQEEWKLKVNANYQEVMKTALNLVTASLFLPILFIRTFLGIDHGPLKDKLLPSAYCSWKCLFAALLFGMLFYWASAKFVKLLCGGEEKWP